MLSPKRGPPASIDAIEGRDGPGDRLARLVGARVRDARIRSGLTLMELAARVQLPSGSLASIENGALRAGAEQLWEISQCVDRPISFFFTDEPEDDSSEPTQH